MASIVPTVNKKSISIASHTTISNPSKEKKLSKPKRTGSTNLVSDKQIRYIIIRNI